MSFENPTIKDALELAYMQGQKNSLNGHNGDIQKINETVDLLHEKIRAWEIYLLPFFLS